MNMFSLLVRCLAMALPLPNWTDKEAVDTWLENIGPNLAEVIAEIFSKAKDGSVKLELPDGQVIDLMDPKCGAIPDMPAAWGDGAILAALAKLLPILIQVLPYFLSPAPDPAPAPAPVL